jgi:cAMP-binding proteins - catabolite gene activator and regulatory subunit of cAMP-dependent protein kinases
MLGISADATIVTLMDGGRVIEFPAGHTVYAEADAERLAVFYRACFASTCMPATDARSPCGTYGGVICWVGRRSLADPHRCSCRLSPGEAFFFDIDRVKRVARSDASVAWALAEESVHRLYDILEELAGNAFASVRQRVARHLLDLAASRQASGRLTAFVSQQDLANSVGSVREVVARVLAELRKERLVRTAPGRVEILDPIQMSRELWSRARGTT